MKSEPIYLCRVVFSSVLIKKYNIIIQYKLIVMGLNKERTTTNIRIVIFYISNLNIKFRLKHEKKYGCSNRKLNNDQHTIFRSKIWKGIS